MEKSTKNFEIDNVDLKILSLLMQDATMAYTEIGKRIFVSGGTVHVRMKKMDILAIADQPGLLVVALLWMAFHVVLMVGFCRLIRAPYFLLAVGSQACIGGPATAPVVAAAFHPALAPVGVLMAILGYAVGTYMGYVCGVLMQLASP